MFRQFIPTALHEEIDTIDVCASPAEAYALCRHLDLGRSPLIKGLFGLRTLPDRLRAHPEPLHLRIDDLARPGFQILADRPDQGFVVGAIAKVWEAEIPYRDITPEAFADFDEPGWARVVWSLSFLPAAFGTRIELRLRIDATDSDSMLRLERYFKWIGPFSHFIRRHLLGLVGHELGLAEADENLLPLPGDEILPTAQVQVTHGISLAAEPEAVWPWLVQMGCRRAGWYSYDLLDNGGEASAHEILPQFQNLAVGDELPMTPIGEASFTVLKLEPNRLLLLGTCFDINAERSLAFDGPLPARYLRDTWAFVLEPALAGETRLRVRVRAEYQPDGIGLRALWMLPLHHLMESRQLQNLKQRVEGVVPADPQAKSPL